MAKEIHKPKKPLVFEQLKRTDAKGNEFWSARELSKVLEYSEYRHFIPVMEKAKEAAENSGQSAPDHFEDLLDMIEIGKGGRREIENVKLSRYACYLIVQNADPAKEVVALGQTYFAVQTRLQEIQQMKAYGGLDAKGIHIQKRLKKSEQILDHMGSTELAANLFRATQTEDKLQRDKIQGKKLANQTHLEIGKKVRRTILEIGGTMPENLPVVGSVKKLDKKQSVKSIQVKVK